jgi:hypothetical protein
MELATAKISRRAVQTIWNPIHNELCDLIKFVAISPVEHEPGSQGHAVGKAEAGAGSMIEAC